ncbi:unnamed protein product [Dovyalis caffra]|uniref:Protein NRT1/ PTR FAMILY 5.10-like n=1 Tax=Dovyalis caffra TaxID=77055 RepID=A0AAV1S366_9ROSI|nr:unnamed protein product [Dovyalis caffra]
MSISNLSSPETAEQAETPLLSNTVDGCVDYKGNPVYRYNSGRWRSASFIIGVEVAERFAFLGISSNLITYLTGPLGQSTATAAENVNVWSGTASLLPLLGAFVADSFLGRFRTIVVASFVYILHLAKEGTSLVFRLLERINLMDKTLRNAEPKAHSSIGGSKRYRYTVKREEKNAFLRTGKVFFVAIRNQRITPSAIASEEEEGHGTLDHQSYEQFKFLNKALLAANGSKEDGTLCTLSEVEETKAVLRLIPIWTTCLAYAIVFPVSSTFFVKEAATMDRSISPGFEIPAASLQTFSTIASILFIAIYDRVFVPVSRTLTRKPSGITVLQRTGIGMFLSTVSIAVAALVEMKRLKTAQEYGLIDKPNVMVPMSVWWLIPPYILFGVSDVFTMVGLQELFYDQVPSDLRSVGLSLYLSIFGVGSFLSSFLISTIEKLTCGNGRYSWFDNNLNRAHLDYFYWGLAVLSTVQLLAPRDQSHQTIKALGLLKDVPSQVDFLMLAGS